MLYGLPEARKLLHAGGGDALVVVEGYMDVIACQRAGVAAVASMGTALTETQMELLWRLHGEPTLCFDGDRAGRQAAARAIDRALPLLKPGKSFRFAKPTGGKDPDDVLREQGAAALKQQLSETTPFVEALFTRERDLEPLDTPERRASLKQRLRAFAGQITDKDLAQAYREDLFTRLDGLFAREQGPTKAPFVPRGRGRYLPGVLPPAAPTEAGRQAARRLAGDLQPLSAALMKYALIDPAVLDDHLEDLESWGLGDETLAGMAGEIIRLRLEADRLDSDALTRHLAARGYSAQLNDIDRAAPKAGAPFLQSDVTLAAARSQWSHAISVLSRLAALDVALASAKHDLAGGSDAAGLMTLKTERDSLRRAVKTGTIWTEDGSS